MQLRGTTVKEHKSSRHISGTTWDVYLYILTSREPVGVREVWRNLKLSSPSLAQYHINKLLALELLHQTRESKYLVKEREQVEVLRSFVLLRGRLVPRLIFYSAFIAGLLAAYLIFGSIKWNFRDIIVLVISIFSLATFLFEAFSQYRGLKMTVQKV